MRYEISRGGRDEPGLILILDRDKGLVVARSSEIAADNVRELVSLANAGAAQQGAASPGFDAVVKALAEAYEAWATDTITGETTVALDRLMRAYDDWLD